MSTYRLCRFTMKHGNKQDIPELLLGEPAFCKDTGELYVGNGIGKEPTRVGSISEEQLKALEKQISDILELAKKMSSTLETDLMAGTEKLGKLTINSQGVNVSDIDNNVKFSIDTSFTTYIENLRVKNLSFNSANTGLMPVTRGNKEQLRTYYVSPVPKGLGDGTSRENACSDIYTVADTIFKEYGYLCPATKIQIWIEPGLYTQDMSIPQFPGNIWDIYLQTDVNGTTSFNQSVNVYASNSSIHFLGNVLGIIKFPVVPLNMSTSVNAPFKVYGCNVNVEFSYCHWLSSVTSEYKKYCIHILQGSRQTNFTFNNCDFYGFDALLYKEEHHGELIMRNNRGNLDNWVEPSESVFVNSLGLRVYINGTYPVFKDNSNSLADFIMKGEPTPTNSIYYKVTQDPGGSGVTIAPPTTTETEIRKEERLGVDSQGTRIYNWQAIFEPSHDPWWDGIHAVPRSYGESSLSGCLSQGSLAVADTRINEIIHYTVDYGVWAFSESLLKYFHELGDKERAGIISNLTAKFVFTQQFYYSNVSKPRIIYPVAGIDIPNHMLTDTGYYVTQQGEKNSEGRPTYILELDGDHPLASKLKYDLFYSPNLVMSKELYNKYGESAYYGIQIGSNKNPDHGRFTVELVISYKEKATIVG